MLRSELKIASIFLLLVGVFTVFDIIEDAIEGISFWHVLIESLIVACSLFGVTSVRHVLE